MALRQEKQERMSERSIGEGTARMAMAEWQTGAVARTHKAV